MSGGRLAGGQQDELDLDGIAVYLTPVEHVFGLECGVSLVKLHVRISLGKVHLFVNSDSDVLDVAVVAEYLLEVLIVDVAREVAHVQNRVIGRSIPLLATLLTRRHGKNRFFSLLLVPSPQGRRTYCRRRGAPEAAAYPIIQLGDSSIASWKQ